MVCSRREEYEIGSGTFCIVFEFFSGCVSLFSKQEGDRGEGLCTSSEGFVWTWARSGDM